MLTKSAWGAKLSWFVLVAVLGVGLTVVCASGASTPTPERPAVIKYASPWSADICSAFAMKKMAAEIEKRSGGRVKFEWYFSGSVVKPKEELPAILSGIVDWAPVHPIYYVSDLPMAQWSWVIPFIPSSEHNYVKLSNRLLAEFPEMKKEIEKHPVKFWGDGTHGQYDFNGKFPLVKIEDMKGKKVITLGKWEPKWVEVGGGVPINVPLPERYTAFQTGLADANTGAVEYFVGYDFITAGAKYITFVGFGSRTSGYQVMNQKKWDSLPKDIQAIFNEVVPKFLTWTADFGKENRDGWLAKAKTKNYQENTLAAAEKTKWGAMIKPIVQEFIDDLEKRGLPGKRLVKRIQEISKELGQPLPTTYVD